MAETVHLYLKINGVDVQGESTQTSLGRAGSIECLSFRDAVKVEGREAATYEPLRILKRIDKSSPRLAQAAIDRAPVSGSLRFFRPSPSGDGTTQHYFTVAFEDGRVTSVTRVSPDVLDPASAIRPPTEEVTFSFGKITWTYEDGGVKAVGVRR